MAYGSSENDKKMKKFILLFLFTCWVGASEAQTPEHEYVGKFKDLAVRQMNQFGVPASVILAVAIHESAYGKSKIARNLNNHFGIKGKNQVKNIRSAYKSYGSVEDSYSDFLRLLNEKPGFSKLFGKYTSYNYTAWVKGIQRGGYAQSSTWASQVLGIIKKHQLYQYDNKPSVLTDSIFTDSIIEVERFPAQNNRVYKVKSGDTLSGIGKKLGLSVKTLMKKNNLQSTRIKPGQKLRY